MHLPYIQVEQDGIEDAKRMARLLGIPEAYGVGLVTVLIQWGLAMSPDGDFSGCIRDPHPREMVAAALGWPLPDAERLWSALERSGFVQSAAASATQTDRMRGLDRYRSAWLKNRRKKGGKNGDSGDEMPETGADQRGTSAEPAENPRGSVAEPERQTQTQTQIEALPPSEVVPAGAAAPPTAATPAQGTLVEETSTTKGPTIQAHAFGAWAQDERMRLLGPTTPREKGLKRHQWSSLGELLRDHGQKTAQAAWLLWAADRYPLEQGLPLGLFASQWPDWVARVQHSGAPGRRAIQPSHFQGSEVDTL